MIIYLAFLLWKHRLDRYYELNLQNVNSYKKVLFNIYSILHTNKSCESSSCENIMPFHHSLNHQIHSWIVLSPLSFFQLCIIIIFCSPLQISGHYSSLQCCKIGALASFLPSPLLAIYSFDDDTPLFVVSDSPWGEVSTKFTITLSCAPLSNIGLL